jgi:hypothetical protein
MEISNGFNKKPPAVGIIVLVAGLIGLVLGISGTVAYNSFKVQPVSTVVPTSTTTVPSTSTTKAQIKEAVAATSIDKDGKGINPSDSFNAKTDKSIYVIGTLEGVSKGSKIEYVRYLNGKYLDSKIATIAKDNLSYYSFVWTSKTTKNEHPVGVYTVKLYLNGNVNEAITYIIK